MEAQPELRRRHGIVHTPPEVAGYCAGALDRVLTRAVGLSGGLSDSSLAVVDPATGPGAFLASALSVVAGRSTRPAALVGLDCDPVALAEARRALAPAADAEGVRLVLEEADTLTRRTPLPDGLPGRAVAVLANPPWSSRTGRRATPELEPLLEDFRREGDGTALKERKVGVLADDYVRFLRWACELVRCAPWGGALAFVTNASFLDGPVHRGVRAALMRWFDGIEVVDLGGSALVARAEGRDDNVFGVRPAVAITVAYRAAGSEPWLPSASVRYTRVRGTRQEKLDVLSRGRPRFARLSPSASSYWFVPMAREAAKRDRVSLADAMPFHREGVQTNRDVVAVAPDRVTLLARLRAFAAGGVDGVLARAAESAGHYDPERARASVARALAMDPEGAAGVSARRLAYRPFDERWFVPVAPLCHRPRPALLNAVDRSEGVLLTVRKDRGDRPWAHFGLTRAVPDNCWLSARSSCRTRAFPTHGPDGEENLDPAVRATLAARVGAVVSSSDFVRYVLCLLASSAYRDDVGSSLRFDYPPIPLPSDRATWDALVNAGAALERAFVEGPGEPGLPGQTLAVGHLRLDPAPAELRAAVDAADGVVQGSGVLE
jgi:predicted helicase